MMEALRWSIKVDHTRRNGRPEATVNAGWPAPAPGP